MNKRNSTTLVNSCRKLWALSISSEITGFCGSGYTARVAPLSSHSGPITHRMHSRMRRK
ncbi:hypothetical protein D3C87_2129210 [compost metagenome]